MSWLVNVIKQKGLETAGRKEEAENKQTKQNNFEITSYLAWYFPAFFFFSQENIFQTA